MHKGTIVCSITFENWLVRNSNIIVVIDIEVTPGKKVCDSDKYAMRIRRSIFLRFFVHPIFIQIVFSSSSAAHYS